MSFRDELEESHRDDERRREEELLSRRAAAENCPRLVWEARARVLTDVDEAVDFLSKHCPTRPLVTCDYIQLNSRAPRVKYVNAPIAEGWSGFPNQGWLAMANGGRLYRTVNKTVSYGYGGLLGRNPVGTRSVALDVGATLGDQFVPVEDDSFLRFDAPVLVDEQGNVHWGPRQMRLNNNGDLQELVHDTEYHDRIPIAVSRWEPWSETRIRDLLRGLVDDSLRWSRSR